MTELSALLPELAAWNDGCGISPLDRLKTFVRSDHAVTYAQLVWPAFVEHEEYVFRRGFSVQTLREWERTPGLERWQIEAMLNTVHLDDLLFVNEEWSLLVEQRAVYLGKMLSETYAAKLAHDFPYRKFIVEACDGSRSENDQISLSFCQQP